MIRVLLAKMGLDCHDTAIVTMRRPLRDAGMEVIYLGLHNCAAKLAAAAEQESVDVVGLSFLSGQQLPQTRKLSRSCAAAASTTRCCARRRDPDRRTSQKLEEMGVDAVFTPGDDDE